MGILLFFGGIYLASLAYAVSVVVLIRDPRGCLQILVSVLFVVAPTYLFIRGGMVAPGLLWGHASVAAAAGALAWSSPELARPFMRMAAFYVVSLGVLTAMIVPALLVTVLESGWLGRVGRSTWYWGGGFAAFVVVNLLMQAALSAWFGWRDLEQEGELG